MINANGTGFIGGAQVGYNWQVAPNWVIGVEWMFDGSALSASTTTGPGGMAANTRIDWLTMVTGRAGYAMNNWLVYGKGGAALVRDRFSLTDAGGDNPSGTAETSAGWVAGAGLEYGITQNWTLKVDYSHIGGLSTGMLITGVGNTATFSRTFDLATVGINYKF